MKTVIAISAGALVALGFLVLSPRPAQSDDIAPQERWMKVSGKGKVLPVEGGPWTCVQDLKTGLMWENLTDNEGARYEDSTYSWYDAGTKQGTPDNGSCMKADRSIHACDTADLVEIANRDKWCGVTGWRVPADTELKSLLFDTGFEGNARIAYGYFPNTGRHAFWTSSVRTNAQGELEVAGVHFGSGETSWLPPRRALRVRLVTSAALSPLASPPVEAASAIPSR
jgi:hypothetical protein